MQMRAARHGLVRAMDRRAVAVMRIAVLAIALAGCVAHSLPLYGGQAGEITVEGSRFLVRFTDTRAEASRMSPEAAPQRMEVLSRALRAIETVSGCRVRPGTLYGDWTLVEAYLSCPDAPSGRLQPVQSHGPPV